MKARELVGRCVKARIVSWLNSNTVGAVLANPDGHGIVLAVYNNGRYVEPEMVHVPSSPAELWGPDGPIYRSGQEQPQEKPEEGGEQEEQDGTDE
jgi:hypothetical protein